MKYRHIRKFFISISLFLIIVLAFRTFIITHNDFSRTISEDKAPIIRLIDYEFCDSLILLSGIQNRIDFNSISYTNSTFSILKTWEFVIVLQFSLLIIAIDIRKQITKLILQHYEGGKYKYTPSL